MLNLVKEGHRYERKFEKIEGGFQSTLYPLPFVKSFSKLERKRKAEMAVVIPDVVVVVVVDFFIYYYYYYSVVEELAPIYYYPLLA